jgi:hypothetical protein
MDRMDLIDEVDRRAKSVSTRPLSLLSPFRPLPAGERENEGA